MKMFSGMFIGIIFHTQYQTGLTLELHKT